MQADPSIKAIIVKIDSEKHDFIVEDLDDETVVVKESKLTELKERLKEVRSPVYPIELKKGSDNLIGQRIKMFGSQESRAEYSALMHPLTHL